MRYHTNFIGSLFGFFGGQKIIAVPDIDDIAGMPEIRIKILRTIADSAVLENILFKDNPKARKQSVHIRIKAGKVADYQERMIKANGYLTGAADFTEMKQIQEDMAEDWWLN